MTIQAKITAIDKTLAELKDQLERGFIDIAQYTRLKTDWERQKAELEAQLLAAPPPQAVSAVEPPAQAEPHGEHKPDATPPSAPAPLPRTAGSPFVVGRPLRAHEPIFGRQTAFRFIAQELAKFSSVNIVGQRRMGKTSLLNHLLGYQDAYLTQQPDQSPLVLACLDLQASISSAARFYGVALRELLDRLPAGRSAEARELLDLRQRLHAKPASDYDEFEHVLKQLRDERGVCVRPVLVIDEFERLIEPLPVEGFPRADFFDGLRALATADLIALIVASRRPLADYFRDPALSNSLTSSFPTYLTLFTLEPLDDASADALLLQASDHPLTVAEAAEAKRWASGHPCHLQVAGCACYEAKSEGRAVEWVHKRREELRGQSCMVGADVASASVVPATRGKTRTFLRRLWAGLLKLVRLILIEIPIRVGRFPQRLGAKIDDVAAWMMGLILCVLIILLLLGVVTGGEVWSVLRKWLGLS